jgi:hypothetical protein
MGICLGGSGAIGQSADRYVGTVQTVKTTPPEIEIKNDSGASQTVRVISETLFQRVSPGAKDLKSAQTASVADVSAGDRVLVALQPGTQDLLRLVIMPAADIAKRNEAEREDWRNRGVGGVVSSVTGNEITIHMRSMMPGSSSEAKVVAVEKNTVLRRYAPDSVRFADASAATLTDISVGDQLRARGSQSEDGTRLSADEVVFGTFVTKLGSVIAVDAANRQLTITDTASNQPLTVRLAEGSQIKRMPEMPFGGPGGSPGGPSPQKQPSGGMPGPMSGMRPPDISQMIEAMPGATIEEVRPGETIVVSATKSNASDHVTAITIVANAATLVRMASMFSGGTGRGAGAGPQGGMNGGLGGMPNGLSLDGMQIPGMMQ